MSRVFLLSDDLRLRGQIAYELARSHHLVHARGLSPLGRPEACDVIILDCANEAAAARVRLHLLRNNELAAVPLVAIAHSSEEAHAYGAQALLPRPLHPGDVTHVVAALVSAPSPQQL
jgi:hypothetical protein